MVWFSPSPPRCCCPISSSHFRLLFPSSSQEMRVYDAFLHAARKWYTQRNFCGPKKRKTLLQKNRSPARSVLKTFTNTKKEKPPPHLTTFALWGEIQRISYDSFWEEEASVVWSYYFSREEEGKRCRRILEEECWKQRLRVWKAWLGVMGTNLRRNESARP